MRFLLISLFFIGLNFANSQAVYIGVDYQCNYYYGKLQQDGSFLGKGIDYVDSFCNEVEIDHKKIMQLARKNIK